MKLEDSPLFSQLSLTDLMIRLPALKRDLVVWSLKFPSFRERLLADAKATVEEEVGLGLAQGVTIKVYEETSEQLFLVIPRYSCQNQQLAMRLGELGFGDDIEAIAAWVLGADGSSIGSYRSRLDGVEVRLVARAWRDEKFKKALLTDPHTVIEDEVGRPVPEGIRISVLEETGNMLHIVLPACIDGDCSNLGEFSAEDIASLAVPMVAGSPSQSQGDFCNPWERPPPPWYPR